MIQWEHCGGYRNHSDGCNGDDFNRFGEMRDGEERNQGITRNSGLHRFGMGPGKMGFGEREAPPVSPLFSNEDERAGEVAQRAESMVGRTSTRCEGIERGVRRGVGTEI